MVCGATVRAPSCGPDAVCESAHCRVLLARREYMSADAFRFLVEARRRHKREQDERTEAERLRRAERNARDDLEHESIRDAACRKGRLPASGHPLLVLPSGPRALEPLTPQRRNRYREHLEAMIAAAGPREGDDAATGHDASIAAGPAVPLAAQLCTLCGGGCCSRGGDKAYLNEATIRRFMRLRPDLPPEELAEAYLALLPDETVAGSCINHTATGCSLPRDMRSDTCNDYFCSPMRSWQSRCTHGERPPGAFVIQRRQDNWNKDRLDLANDVVGISIVTDAGSLPL